MDVPPTASSAHCTWQVNGAKHCEPCYIYTNLSLNFVLLKTTTVPQKTADLLLRNSPWSFWCRRCQVETVHNWMEHLFQIVIQLDMGHPTNIQVSNWSKYIYTDQYRWIYTCTVRCLCVYVVYVKLVSAEFHLTRQLWAAKTLADTTLLPMTSAAAH